MTRKMLLPDGWYPHNSKVCKNQIEKFLDTIKDKESDCVGTIVPHAGWYFCGKLACQGIASLRSNAELVVLYAGHMPSTDQIQLFDFEDYETPFGNLKASLDYHGKISEKFKSYSQPEFEPDNTSEVLLPLIKYFQPQAKILIVRNPASMTSLDLGRFLAKTIEENVVFIGSTDLTHYGPNYGFEPAGRGENGSKWARNNDREIIKLLINSELEKAISHANDSHSACSIGAASSTLASTKEKNTSKIIELGYTNSNDVAGLVNDSFVGYTSIVLK